MKYNVKTQQGKTYELDDDSVWVWIELERETGLTYGEAVEKMQRNSFDTITTLLYLLAKDAGHTELKTHKAWVKTEFDEFDLVESDPKASEA